MTASNSRELARGTGLLFAGALAYQVFEYLYRILLARGLDVDAFGTFHQARAVFLLAVGLASLGLAEGVRQFVAASRTEGTPGAARRAIRDGSRLVAGGGVAGALLLFALAGPLGHLFHNEKVVGPIRVLALAIPLTTTMLFTVRLGEAVRSYRASVIVRQMLDPFLRFSFGAVLLVSGAGLTRILGGYVAASLVSMVVALVLVTRLRSLHELDRGVSPSRTADLLRYSMPLAFGYIVHGLAERIDIVMIGIYLDEGRVGLYASGSLIARTLLILMATTMPVTATLAAECAGRGDFEGIAALRARVSRWMVLFGGPVCMLFLLFPQLLVTVLFGAEYGDGGSILRLLAPAYLVTILLGPLGVFVSAMGRTTWTLHNTLVRTAVNIVLNALLIPRWGLPGAAVATTIALVVGTTLYWFQLRTLVPLGLPLPGCGRLLVSVAMAVIAGAGARLALAAEFPVLVADGGGLVAFLAVYVAALRLIPGCLQEEDLELPRSIVRRLRRSGTSDAGGAREDA